MFITKRVKAIATRRTIVILLSSFAFSCSQEKQEEEISKEPEPLEIKIPANFPEPVYEFANNPITKEGVALGKKLFYDARLSRNNTISCGFCHMQPSGFTHHGHDVSHGVDDKLGRRNSLPIQNLIFYKTFFWDGGVHNLDLVALNAIGNKVEMDEEVTTILAKLQLDPSYSSGFRNAFGSEEITSTKFLQALSQFLATMVSSNSKYDMYVRKESNVTLSETELQGLELFKQSCATCHATDLFTDQSYRNNGFSSVTDFDRDKGREEITLNPNDRGKFKVPSLRNVEYTAPYMHNGKLADLESVLNFYTTGVHDTPTLDPLLNQNGKHGFELSADEKKAIISFLYTLTDEQYLSDKQFSEY
jgi:cytochrome c peroxidase